MKKTVLNYTLTLASVIALTACGGAETSTNTQSSEYPEIPREQLLDDKDAETVKLYAELQERFTQDLDKLTDKIKSLKAKPIFLFVTPEFGNSETAMNRKGRTIIADYCKAKGVEFYDFTAKDMPLGKAIADKPDLAVTQMPKDGHWSVLGAQLVADCISIAVDKNTDYKSDYKHTGEAPTVMGPQKPNENTVLDGGKDLPYRLVTNSQGFRNPKDIPAKSEKQRILMLGDSELFFPFLDYEQTSVALLEKKYTNKEFINGANWGFSINDYSVTMDKSAALAPDIVLIGLNGGDIIDYYFNHRIKFSIDKKEYKPTPSEIAFYKKVFKK